MFFFWEIHETLTSPWATRDSCANTSSVAASACRIRKSTKKILKIQNFTKINPAREREGNKNPTWSLTSTTRQKTWARTLQGNPSAAALSPKCSRCPCGKYTTTLPFFGSEISGPAQACHSSRHTAGVAVAASDSSSSSIVLRSIPIITIPANKQKSPN